MATIANQISRISNATDLLRKKGSTGAEGIIGLNLTVPAGNYWDKNSKAYVQQTAASLGPNDQIDKIAAAFCNMPTEINKEILVPIKIMYDGTTAVTEGTTLEAGFYAGAKIKPYVEVETDVVLNIEDVKNRVLTAKSATISPSAGYNYISLLQYTVQSGAIQTTAVRFGNDFVTVQASDSGWIDANVPVDIVVTKSEMTSKVGDGSANPIGNGAVIIPSALGDTTLTITKGLFGTDRTLVVKSVASQTGGSAVSKDILDGKVAWVNGIQVTGSMPNHGGTESTRQDTPTSGIMAIDGSLAIKPALGYYNDYSAITTNVVYNPNRVFNTNVLNSVSGTDTLTSKTYYETIPAGYYADAITRKIIVRDAVGTVNIDYTKHEATFAVSQSGWIASNVKVEINADSATYKQTMTDLESPALQITLTPAENAYLTQVTVDNSLIFDLLSAI